MGVAIGDDNLINQSFIEIKNAIIEQALSDNKYDSSLKMVKNKHKVSLPLRVNFAGGWTDTPPYCIENGGKILNAPILLDGSRPVEVCIEKIKETTGAQPPAEILDIYSSDIPSARQDIAAYLKRMKLD